MLQDITAFEHLNDVNNLRENLTDKPIHDKAIVLSYLRSGKRIAAIAGSSVDLLTKKPIRGEWLVFSDDKYQWTSDMIYYFDKYNLLLTKEFIDYALLNNK